MSKESDDKARALKTWKTLKNASPANKKVIRNILKEERMFNEITKKKNKELRSRKKTKKVKSPHD